jgi:arylsulfatase A-like enzyme
MDSMLGGVLQAVDSKAIKDNTLLVYTTDQGANWPFAKWCVYDGGLRVPFIVRWPGKTRQSAFSKAVAFGRDTPE